MLKKQCVVWIALVVWIGLNHGIYANPNKVKIETDPAKKICFAMYTTHKNILKMNVQFYPLTDEESRDAQLEVKDGDGWKKVSETKILDTQYDSTDAKKTYKLWLAQFRVENWDMSKTFIYRVVGLDGVATYEGTIRKDPVDKEVIVVGALTGNTPKGDWDRKDYVKNIDVQDPDLLFFSGDQTYFHHHHLNGWILFGQQFGELTRNRPAIAIPDDHDVGNGNFWGESGKAWKSSSGYSQAYRSAAYVKSVELVQTSHLPDPVDPKPILRGIGTYFTSIKIGKVDFAIIEDRKFKSSPATLEAYLKKAGIHAKFRGSNIVEYKGTPKQLDLPGGVLLGDRQLAFLKTWSHDWDGVNIKSVLSATPFAKCHSRNKQADLDTDAWPQTGRNKAVEALRKAFALHISGDLHLASVTRYGLDAFRDSSFSFCVPAIANHFVRFWHDTNLEGRPVEGPLPGLGDHIDPFENKLTVHTYANPEGEFKKTKAAGHGIIRFNVKTRKITMECWPRFVDVTKPDAKQFPGWPITISQFDNYDRAATGYLPTIKVTGTTDPVVKLIDQKSGELVYAVRIKGTEFKPRIFAAGTYTITVGEGKATKTFKDLKPAKSGAGVLDVAF
jgi:hypothetical protein